MRAVKAAAGRQMEEERHLSLAVVNAIVTVCNTANIESHERPTRLTYFGL